MQKTIRCFDCNNTHITYEEKESDVRIATRMITDVVTEKCDISILVSADSDLIPPIEAIRELKPSHKIFVYFPPKRSSFDLANKSDGYIKLERHEQKFMLSQLPNEIYHPKSGYAIKRPLKWM